ncbi:hypothetical protein, partial [Blautia sp. AM42-2]
NSLHATARNFDTPSYWTLTLQLAKSWSNLVSNRIIIWRLQYKLHSILLLSQKISSQAPKRMTAM